MSDDSYINELKASLFYALKEEDFSKVADIAYEIADIIELSREINYG